MADDKKQKEYRGRQAYLRDFKQDENGNYVYRGNTYDVKDAQLFKRTVKLIWILAGFLIISLIVQGTIPASGMLNTFYIIIPYMLELLSCGLLVYSTAKLTWAQRPLREYIYKATVPKIPARALATSVFAFISAFMYVLWLILGGIERYVWCAVLFIIFNVMNGAGCIVIRKAFLKNSFEKLARHIIPLEDKE